MRDWITLREVEENYKGIKAITLRSYILRNQVIPEGAYEKIGNQWFLKRDWVDANYQKRDGKPQI